MNQHCEEMEKASRATENGVSQDALAFMSQSPISMWVMNQDGTVTTENSASRQLFGLGDEETLVGKYNIFKDDEIIVHGYAPRIRRVFEEGGSADFTVHYKFSYVRCMLPVHPAHTALRIFIFSPKEPSGRDRSAIVQHEDYTEAWRRETTLAESEAHYRGIIEQLSDWVWVVDLDGRLLYSNPVAEEILGLRIEEILGRCIIDFTAPNDRECIRQKLRDLVRTRSGISQLAWTVMRSDGSTRHLEARGEPVFDQHHSLIGYRGIARDFTERHDTEEAVRRSEQRFRTIFDHMPAAIFAYDRDGVILQANTACERIYGLAPEHLVGQSLFGTVIKTEERERAQSIIARVFSGETVKHEEWQVKLPDGSPAYMSANTAPLYDESGNVELGIGLNVDITERKIEEQRKLELERNKREFYRTTLLAATDGKLIICDDSDIEKMSGPSIASWKIVGPEDASVVRHGVEEIARNAGMEESKIFDLVLCAGELATNVIKHAGSGQASVHQLPDALLFVCRDKGPGIEAKILPQATLRKGYSTIKSLGMGYKEVIVLSDTVNLATGPTGTTAAVEMKLNPQAVRAETLALLDKW